VPVKVKFFQTDPNETKNDFQKAEQNQCVVIIRFSILPASWAENPRVGGSIPSLGTIIIKGLAVMPLTPFLLGCAWVADCCGLYRSHPVPKSLLYAASEASGSRCPADRLAIGQRLHNAQSDP
jgi:hypothetical protein